MMIKLKLGTRASPLALAQTDRVIQALGTWGHGGQAKTFSTQGDRVQDRPLQDLGDKGVFTAELEAALRAGQIDAAVHSAKDMSAIDDPDLPLVAALPRDSRGDVLIAKGGQGLGDLSAGTRIGTSSLRRASQIRALRPDLTIVPIRGNLQTRLKKWRAGEVEALILAAAGLERMGLDQDQDDIPMQALTWPYAPAQGIIAIQATKPSVIWDQINDPAAMQALMIERALIRGLGANCRQPVACQVQIGTTTTTLDIYAWDVGGQEHHLHKTLAPALSDQALCQQAQALGQQLRAHVGEGLAAS